MKVLNLLLMFTASVFLVACGGDGPEEVAEEFAHALIDGDAEEVLDLMYISPKMQQDIDNTPNGEEVINNKLSTMMAQVEAEIEKAGGVKDIKSGEAEYNEDKTKATVPVTVTLEKDDESTTDDFKLIKTDDGWKVKL